MHTFWFLVLRAVHWEFLCWTGTHDGFQTIFMTKPHFFAMSAEKLSPQHIFHTKTIALEPSSSGQQSHLALVFNLKWFDFCADLPFPTPRGSLWADFCLEPVLAKDLEIDFVCFPPLEVEDLSDLAFDFGWCKPALCFVSAASLQLGSGPLDVCLLPSLLKLQLPTLWGLQLDVFCFFVWPVPAVVSKHVLFVEVCARLVFSLCADSPFTMPPVLLLVGICFLGSLTLQDWETDIVAKQHFCEFEPGFMLWVSHWQLSGGHGGLLAIGRGLVCSQATCWMASAAVWTCWLLLNFSFPCWPNVCAGASQFLLWLI